MLPFMADLATTLSLQNTAIDWLPDTVPGMVSPLTDMARLALDMVVQAHFIDYPDSLPLASEYSFRLPVQYNNKYYHRY
jgi:hypothetical protein